MNIIENSLAQNRAEELGYDLWEEFVIPPFYDSLNLLGAKKPRVIVGGRGCGKTSLLRYLCHQTQFSSKRGDITKNDIESIGIYWRVDTQYAKILAKRGFDEEQWIRAFEHLSVLMMSQEILKSLESIANSSLKSLTASNLDSFDLSILTSFNKVIPTKFSDLKQYIRREINYFQVWAGSIRSIDPPVFLPLRFAIELIVEIKNQNSLFSKTNYLVYIDEYENLLIDQQRLINTWLKHSEAPLIFNLAMKPNSFIDKKTIGNESIAETHDYREYDLEEYYKQINFELFAAEILFLRLWKNDGSFKIPIVPEELRNTDKSIISKRKSSKYSKRVLASARDFLPSKTFEEMAKNVFTDSVLLGRLKLLLKKAPYVNDNNIESFLLPEYPQASVIIPSLLYRNTNFEDLLNEIKKLKKGEDNKFTGSTAWIHNNLFACLLLIYEPLGRICPLYAGFDAFCLMSKTNLRHFLELCNKSFINETLGTTNKKVKSISIKSQSEAAKQASITFLREVKNFGNNGNRLHTFVLRLGTYFSYSHKKPSQSEPEQNHFTVKGTKPSELINFLSDAVKWSVIYEGKITKQKGGKNKFEVEDYEYILNPIYAPYFHISYRKKRSVQFSIDEIQTIAFGNYEKFEYFLRSKLTDWKVSPSETIINLFSDLEP